MSTQMLSLIFILITTLIALPLSSRVHMAFTILILALVAFCSFVLGIVWEGPLL